MTDLEFDTHELYKRMQDAPARWNEGERVRRMYAAQFYQGIYGMPRTVTGYQSRDAFLKVSRRTDDHFLSARLVYRAMMDQCPEINTDYIEFSKLVETCRNTIRITSAQNNGSIKFRMKGARPVINMLTIDKYDDWGWYKVGTGFLTSSEFPLKHLVPDWLTEFERRWVA